MLDWFDLYTLKLKSCRMIFVFGEERVEVHTGICGCLVAYDLFLAQEEVHVYLLLAFLDLSSNAVYRLVQDFKHVQSPINIHDFAAHCYHDCPYENPWFLLHFWTHHQRTHEVYLFKLHRLFGRSPLTCACDIPRSVNILWSN